MSQPPKMWYNGLPAYMEKTIAGPSHRHVPAPVWTHLLHLDLGLNTSSTPLTLKIMSTMADTALAMVLDMMPQRAHEVQGYLALKSPSGYTHAFALLQQCGPHEQATAQARACVASLISATRDTYSREGTDVARIGQMSTAAAVAKWTAVYWEHYSAKGADRSDSLVALMLFSLHP